MIALIDDSSPKTLQIYGSHDQSRLGKDSTIRVLIYYYYYYYILSPNLLLLLLYS
jgi:hypothetical protein